MRKIVPARYYEMEIVIAGEKKRVSAMRLEPKICGGPLITGQSRYQFPQRRLPEVE